MLPLRRNELQRVLLVSTLFVVFPSYFISPTPYLAIDIATLFENTESLAIWPTPLGIDASVLYALTSRLASYRSF